LLSARQRYLFIALALLWLALRIPDFGARFSFDWDASQYARGMREFDIVKHQPQPPGYLLWVLSSRSLMPLAGGPMPAQTLVAFLMSVAALAIFYALALHILQSRLSALISTTLLAFAPTVALNSSIASPSITDLVASAVAGYLAFLGPRRKRWRIILCLVALAVLAGFHQSNLALLLPLVVAALIGHWRYAWRPIITGSVLASLAFLAWYLPLAQTVGGSRVLAHLSSGQFQEAAHLSSVFYGAPLRNHLSMLANNLAYAAINLSPWLIAFGLPLWAGRKSLPGGWWRYALWMAPTLVTVFLIHGARAGYWLIAFPPMLLLCAWLGQIRVSGMIAGVLLSLAISYFPYGRFQFSKIAPISYVIYRSTPRIALDIEASQRNLDQSLRQLQQSGAPQPFVCARDNPEAPNIRSVTYDFAYVHWVTPEDAPRGRSVWLFDQHGPDRETRQRYPNWRQLAGDQFASLWEAVPSP